ncbi:pilin [Patescibacteria group bacterium]|nr:pilin [Patescibacteria group bacterium]MBU1016414.1 pilin [Patescibacteria group bacterium]MBU1685162.1 pilin [Patescibacteria group bacterium]MBU1938819.1 pilin [Patescibacteria group bacterium]
MNPIIKSFIKFFITAGVILFITVFIPVKHSQAAIFEGSVTDTELPFGLCLDDPGNKDCAGIDCRSEEDKNNPLCISETAAGTGLAKTSLAGTGITHTENFGDFIKKLVNFSLPYLVLAAFVGYVVAGFMYVTAFGNDEQLQKAKKILIWVSVGLILVILSYAITNLLTGELVTGLQGE